MTINGVDYTNYDQSSPYNIVFIVLFVIGLWRMLTKAGLHGWGALIPLYNAYLLVKLAGWRGWSLLLFIVPVVNLVAYVVLCRDLGRAYGTGLLFKICLVLFLPVAIFVLGVGRWQFGGRLTGSLAG